jgi:hypothetical protein
MIYPIVFQSRRDTGWGVDEVFERTVRPVKLRFVTGALDGD